MSGKELNKVLAELCFKHIRTRGSHKVLEKKGRILVVPLHRELKRGTLKQIITTCAMILGVSYEEGRRLIVDRKYRRRWRRLFCS